KQAFETGKGRVILRGNATIEKGKGNREQIVIDEIPYDVNKATLVRKMDELHAERKVEGIQEVRDETDREGLRIVIELRKDADAEGILNFMYKNTDLQVSYNYNMVAIEDKTPKLLSLPAVLDAYIAHQKDVITRQTTFDLKKAKERAHIVEGLMTAISILDELIHLIRHSENKADAKQKMIARYKFSDEQAEAILALQLYRLTNTDITLLQEEKDTLEKHIAQYEAILASPKKLLNTIKNELKRIKKEYKTERLTKIEAEIEEININIEVTIPNETVIVSVTKEGYVKRTSLRSYAASNKNDLTIKSSDHLIRLVETDTTDDVLLFTNSGKYVSIPVHELPDIRWKDTGVHLSNLTTFESNEHIVACMPVRKFSKNKYVTFVTKQGMIKKTEQNVYQSSRYSRSLIAINLRENDEVVHVFETDGKQDIIIATHLGYGLRFNETEVTPVGQRALGVIAVQLKESDFVVNGIAIDEKADMDLFIATQRGACKRMR